MSIKSATSKYTRCMQFKDPSDTVFEDKYLTTKDLTSLYSVTTIVQLQIFLYRS